MADWRESAWICPRGFFPDLIARPQFVTCKRGAAALGCDPTGTPCGLCDTCCSTARSSTPQPLPPCNLGLPHPPRSAHPRRLLLLGPSAPPPRPAVPQGGVHGFAVSVGSQAGNTVVARSWQDSTSSGTVDRVTGELGAVACSALLWERQCLISHMHLVASAKPQQSPVDPRRLLVLTSSGDGSRPQPLLATAPPEIPSRCAFPNGFRAGKDDGNKDKSTLEAIASVILLRGDRPEIRLERKKGRALVYLRQRSVMKAEVKNSQTKKRRAAALRLQVGAQEVGVARTWRRRPRLSRDAVDISVKEQVGLLAALSMGHVGFNCCRLALGGATSGLCNLPVLRAWRWELSAPPGKQVAVTGSSAYLASLSAAVQERVSCLCDSHMFLERPVTDPAVCDNTAAAEQGPTGVAVSLRGSPPTSEPDVRIVLGLDKNGDPGAEKIGGIKYQSGTPN